MLDRPPESPAIVNFNFMLVPTHKPEELHENIRSSVARNLPVVRTCAPHDEILSIAAGGPSLEDTYKELTGFVATVNGSLSYLLDQDVIPHMCGVCDPSPHMVDIVEADKRITYFLASIVHPSVYDKLLKANCRVFRWNSSSVPGAHEVLNEIEPNWLEIGGGSTMGLRWLTLGYDMGFRKFHFHGMDSSFRSDHPVRGRASHAYKDHQDEKDWMQFDAFQTRPNFIAQVIDFLGWMERLKEPSADPVLIEVFGEGLLQTKFREWKANNPGAHESSDIRLRPPISAASEKSKYTRMWQVPEYRDTSPGEQLVKVAIRELAMQPPDSVLDLGCGTGRSTRRFKDAGFAATGVDITAQSLDRFMDIEFREACLWEMPPDLSADWGFCCDVMEHIPPQFTEATLENIRRACRKGAFFQIAFGHERWGSLIGEVLHLTVMPKDWWREALRRHWTDVREIDAGQHELRGVFACR